MDIGEVIYFALVTFVISNMACGLYSLIGKRVFPRYFPSGEISPATLRGVPFWLGLLGFILSMIRVISASILTGTVIGLMLTPFFIRLFL